MLCQKCGRELVYSQFCYQCGAPVTIPQGTADSVDHAYVDHNGGTVWNRWRVRLLPSGQTLDFGRGDSGLKEAESYLIRNGYERVTLDYWTRRKT